MFRRKCVACLVLVGIMVLQSSLGVFAASIGTTDSQIEDKLILQLYNDLSAMLPEGEEVGEYRIVQAGYRNGDCSINMAEDSKQYVFQKVEYEKDIVEVTTIIPYIGSENGELVNSFQYMQELSQKMGRVSPQASFDFPLINVTITANAQYTSIPSYRGTFRAYRPISVSGYWSSSKYISSASELLVKLDTGGILYSTDAWQTQDYPTPLQEYYTHRIWVDIDNPIEGSSYGNTWNPLASNRCIDAAEGMLLYVSLSYVYNGVAKTEDYSIYLVQP